MAIKCTVLMFRWCGMLSFDVGGDAGETVARIAILTARASQGDADNVQDFALGIANTYGYTMLAGRCTTCTSDGTAPR